MNSTENDSKVNKDFLPWVLLFVVLIIFSWQSYNKFYLSQSSSSLGENIFAAKNLPSETKELFKQKGIFINNYQVWSFLDPDRDGIITAKDVELANLFILDQLNEGVLLHNINQINNFSKEDVYLTNGLTLKAANFALTLPESEKKKFRLMPITDKVNSINKLYNQEYKLN